MAAPRTPLARIAADWLATGVPAMCVEVLQTQGSAPRESGTRMLVSADQVHGTIGGGHLEWRAIADARRLLQGPGKDPMPMPRQHIALGPSLGQCCGGTVDLALQRLHPGLVANWPEPAQRFFLQLYGAGHVGRAIVALLAGLPCRVQWIDERESEFPAQHDEPPHIERVCVDPVDAEVAVAPPGAYFLVLTHSHDLDLAIAEAILQRGDFGFFGLIGSRTKRERFLKRFAQRGISAAATAHMQCPIGLPGIRGKEPEVLAVAVVAQLLQHQSTHHTAP